MGWNAFLANDRKYPYIPRPSQDEIAIEGSELERVTVLKDKLDKFIFTMTTA